MRASEFPGILPIKDFGFKGGKTVAKTPAPATQQEVQQQVVSQHEAQPVSHSVSQAVPQLKGVASPGGTINLRAALDKINNRAKEVRNEVQLGTNSFNDEAVKVAIQNFVETKINDSQLFIVLKSLEPKVTGSDILFYVDSNFTEQQILPYKQRLESAIATFVNNRNVTLQIKVVEGGAAEPAKPVYITQADKLNHFIELNPVIAEMVELLGLEIE